MIVIMMNYIMLILSNGVAKICKYQSDQLTDIEIEQLIILDRFLFTIQIIMVLNNQSLYLLVSLSISFSPSLSLLSLKDNTPSPKLLSLSQNAFQIIFRSTSQIQENVLYMFVFNIIFLFLFVNQGVQGLSLKKNLLFVREHN